MALKANALAIIRAMVAPPVKAAAGVKHEDLYDELGKTSGGRGIKYAALPNTSSAAGQSPIKQSGALQEIVGSEKVTDTMWRVGMFPRTLDEAKKAFALEFGYQPNNLEARAYLERVRSNPESNQRAYQAALKAR